MPLFTFRATNHRLFTWGIVMLTGNIMTFRVTGTANKHTVAAIFHHQRLATLWTLAVLKYFDFIAIMMSKRTNKIALRVTSAAQKRPRFTITNDEF